MDDHRLKAIARSARHESSMDGYSDEDYRELRCIEQVASNIINGRTCFTPEPTVESLDAELRAIMGRCSPRDWD